MGQPDANPLEVDGVGVGARSAGRRDDRPAQQDENRDGEADTQLAGVGTVRAYDPDIIRRNRVGVPSRELDMIAS